MQSWENFMTAEEYQRVQQLAKQILALEKKIKQLKKKKLDLSVDLMQNTAFGRLAPKLRKQLWADLKRRFK